MLLNDKVPFRMQWPQYADLQVNGMVIKAKLLHWCLTTDRDFRLCLKPDFCLCLVYFLNHLQVWLFVLSIDLAHSCLELMVVMMVQL
jgi:hypothetical protein